MRQLRTRAGERESRRGSRQRSGEQGPRWRQDQSRRAPPRNCSESRWSRRGSRRGNPPGRAEGGGGRAGAMELLKLNRSAPGSGPGPGASLCRPGGPFLNSSGIGNLSCEPPRIRGAGTRGECLPEPFPQGISHYTTLIEGPHCLHTASSNAHTISSRHSISPSKGPLTHLSPQLIKLHPQLTLPSQNPLLTLVPRSHPELVVTPKTQYPPQHTASFLLDTGGGGGVRGERKQGPPLANSFPFTSSSQNYNGEGKIEKRKGKEGK